MNDVDKAAVIILGAGRPYRGSDPSALIETAPNRRVLDWILEAFSGVVDAEFHFVGGYNLDRVIEKYPHVRFSVNRNWRETGPAGSLLSAPLEPGRLTFVCYADVVFNAELVRRVCGHEGQVVLAMDRLWRDRYPSRPLHDVRISEKAVIREGAVVAIGGDLDPRQADAEYVGLMKLSPEAVAFLRAMEMSDRTRLSKEGIPAVVREFQRGGLEVRAAEIAGSWATLNVPQDLARFVLGGKAETLERLRPLVRRSRIGEQVRFTRDRWQREREGILKSLEVKFGGRVLAIRSSARDEDGWRFSQAGAFASVLAVPGGESARVAAAVDAVVRSYEDDDPGHHIFVQEMVHDVLLSGVVFTRTLSCGGPYITINYDDTSSDTAAVTGGTGRFLRTAVIHRGCSGWNATVDARLKTVVEAVREIEELAGHDSLDVEFALDQGGVVHLLQVRPITVDHGPCRVSDSQVERVIEEARSEFRRRLVYRGFCLGRRTCFGVMPDWNPAEMLGTKPRRLALSLYCRLITDEVWATQRAEHGYRDVRPQPLLAIFAGHPYVDVRATLTSFMPASLPEPLAERLVEHHLDWLADRPHLHDKIEFDVAFTCITFDFERQAAERLGGHGFSPEDISLLRGGLVEVTRAALARQTLDGEHLRLLGERFDRIVRGAGDPLGRTHALLEDCRRMGTLAFAHMARGGFIAASLLRSMERMEIVTTDETERFMKSLNTVARRMAREAKAAAGGGPAWDTHVARYGHLRPGTYEITSPAYMEDPDRYLKASGVTAGDVEDPPREGWSDDARSRIARALPSLGLGCSVGDFETFLRGAIEGREHAKFVFTRNVSEALRQLGLFGAEQGFTREQLSHIRIEDFLALRTCPPTTDIRSWLSGRAEEGMEEYEVTQAVELPPLLLREEDLSSFELPASQPNYVTRGRVTAEIATVGDARGELLGRIVLVARADPGYDWLFAHGIGGLVTMYGGANSHMAIRAAELGLPAAIGVGEALYARLAGARILELNCAARQMRIVE